MSHYPLFLNLHDASCLVVGAGKVGMRKVEGLLPSSPARIVVVDPAGTMAEDLARLAGENPVLEHRQTAFYPDLVSGMTLVFAATPLRQVNRAVAQACRANGILCNIADSAEESDFFVPACVRRGKLTLAVSTEGASPALARTLRQDLEVWLDAGYVLLLDFLEKIRPLVLSLGLGSDADADIFRSLCRPPISGRLMDCLRRGDRPAFEACAQDALPSAFHPCIIPLIAEIWDDLD